MQKQLLNYVMLSNIAVRDDSYQQKVTEKDQHWKELSEEKNIFLIPHDKTITASHCNLSKFPGGIRPGHKFAKIFSPVPNYASPANKCIGFLPRSYRDFIPGHFLENLVAPTEIGYFQHGPRSSK